MSIIKCTFCGKEIDSSVRFCPWCGKEVSMYLRGETSEDHSLSSSDSFQSSQKDHEWPEEEKSVSFTFYDAEWGKQNPSDPEGLQERSCPEKDKWKPLHFVIVFLFLVLFVCLLLFFFMSQDKREARMPDYNNIIEKTEQRKERDNLRQKQKQEDALKLEQELQRIREEEEAEALRRQQEESARDSMEEWDAWEIDF